MKKILLACVIALGLSGCANPPTQEQLADIVARVQDYAAKTCGFLPDAKNLLTIVQAFYPQAGTVGAVVTAAGDAICAAIPTRAAAPGGRSTRIVKTPVGPVPVTGRRQR